VPPLFWNKKTAMEGDLCSTHQLLVFLFACAPFVAGLREAKNMTLIILWLRRIPGFH